MTTETKVTLGIALGTVLLLGGGVWFLGTQGAKEQAKLSQPLMGETTVDQGEAHVPDGTAVEYNTNPPTTGPHYADSQLAGIYDKPVPDGNLLHSMEHGAVILWYKEEAGGLSVEEVEQLKQIFRSVPVSKKIMVPRESLDVPVALTSWGKLLKLQTIDETQIKAFMETNEDRGLEKAPL